MKKIILLSLFAAFSGFLLLIFCSIYLTDYSKIYTDFAISAKIKNIDNSHINYKIHKFPVPSLLIDEIKENEKIEFKNIKIKFSLWSVLSFNHKISDIEIDQLVVYLSNDDVNYIDHDEFISELIQKEFLNISAKIGKLIFVESDKDIPLIIENFTFSGDKKNRKFKGEVASVGNLKGEFIRIDDQINFNLDLDSSGYNLKLKEIYEKSILKSGKMEIETLFLAQEWVSLLPDFANLSTESIANEKVTITLDILPSNKWINFKNILIESKSIKGSGEIALSKDKKDINDVKINFSKFDLDSWSKNEKIANVNQNNLLNSSDLINKMTFHNNTKVTILAKEIILNPNNILTDFSLKFFNQNGQVKVEDLSCAFDKNSGFRVDGIVSTNSFRSIFKGRIAINHKDLNDLAEFIGGSQVRTENKIPYSLVSDIKFSSVDISMQNLVINTASTEITGSFFTKFIANSPRINANLKINKVNLDKGDLPFLNYSYNYALGLTEDSKNENYLNKFIPLREINSISNYDISFDQLSLSNKLYKNVKFNLNLMPGEAKLENLSLNDDKNSVDMTLELIASGIKPSFNIIINSGILEVDFLSPRSFSEMRKQILEKFALDKVDLNINFNLDKLYQGDFSLDRVVLKAKNNKNLFEISKFDTDLLGGRMYSTGSILLEPYTINFVYALNSAIIKEVSKLMPSFFETDGVISINGMWSTNGSSLEEQLYNLYTKSNLIIKDMVVNNLSIDDIVQSASEPDYNIKNFKDDIKQALLTGKTNINELKTELELVKGLFSFKNVKFQTKYTSGAAAANFNLYDMNIDLSSVFVFSLSKQNYGKSYNDYATTKLILKASGNLFSPKKEFDTKEFENLLNAKSTVKNN